jgi:hypothetical protein
MPDHIEYRGFTQTYPSIVNRLITPISIAPVSSRNKAIRGIPVKLKALWDTGAMKSLIKPELVKRLDLQMYRVGSAVSFSGIGGRVKADFTMLTIFLTDNMGIEGCPAYVINFPGGADIIIGMDIINMGDFAVCNIEGQTSFSFAMPPLPDRIDFIDRINILNEQNNRQA